MGLKANGEFVVETLGDMIDLGHGLSAHCENRRSCGRSLELDVYDLVIQFGRRAKKHDYHRIKCRHCGSRDTSWISSSDHRPQDVADREPPTNFRPSRTPDERAALALIFPRRNPWAAAKEKAAASTLKGTSGGCA